MPPVNAPIFSSADRGVDQIFEHLDVVRIDDALIDLDALERFGAGDDRRHHAAAGGAFDLGFL
jgi:hypothetical protein